MMVKPGKYVKVKDGSYVLRVDSGGIDKYIHLRSDKRTLKVLATNCIVPGEEFLGTKHVNDTIIQDMETEEIFFIKAQFLTPVTEKEGRVPKYIDSDFAEVVPEFLKQGPFDHRAKEEK